MEFMNVLILCTTIHVAVEGTTTLMSTSSSIASMSASETPTASSSMEKSTMSMENTATATTSVGSATPSPTPSTPTSMSTSAWVNPNACSTSNPSCDKGKCCENNAVKTVSITFSQRTCINKLYTNTTSCSNICTKQGCSHAAGLVLQIATVLMSFIIYWATM